MVTLHQLSHLICHSKTSRMTSHPSETHITSKLGAWQIYEWNHAFDLVYSSNLEKSGQLIYIVEGFAKIILWSNETHNYYAVDIVNNLLKHSTITIICCNAAKSQRSRPTWRRPSRAEESRIRAVGCYCVQRWADLLLAGPSLSVTDHPPIRCATCRSPRIETETDLRQNFPISPETKDERLTIRSIQAQISVDRRRSLSVWAMHTGAYFPRICCRYTHALERT